MRNNLFKDFSRADAIKAQEDRERMRAQVLDQRRLSENAAIIQCPGEGCAACIDGTKSDSTAAQIDICREQFAYLPLYMDIHNQRPAWCRGFERNGTGVVPATQQEELAL
jgi:hypothetical protein